MNRAWRIVTLGLFCIGLWAGSAQAAPNAQLKPPLGGLPAAEPAEVGIDPAAIAELLQLIRDTPPRDFRGLVVIKDGKLVVEEYFSTYWRATIHDIRSAGKSITALLLGIALDQAKIEGVDKGVFEFFPSYKLATELSAEHRSIQLRHLLMMSSGLEADFADPASVGNAANWLAGEDWVRSALNLPMAFEPGSQWVYNDVCALLAGAMVEELSGQRLVDFAQEHVLAPLGITEFYWLTGPQNRTAGMGNLYLSTLDFAKIGLLMLKGGSWDGQQLVSRRWTEELVKQRFDISGNNPFADGYGYFWYLAEREIGGKARRFYFASGNGGNLLAVIPDENMVVSLTSSAYGQDYGHQRSYNILSALLAAIKK